MSKSFRYNPDEDFDTQISAKQRKNLRKQIKFDRRAREREFEDLEESEESANSGM